MPLKPLKVSGSHPDQKKGVTGDDVKTHGAIWPNAYSGNAQGGTALQRHEDLAPKHLEQHNAAGYSSNSAETRQQQQAKVTHTFKGAGPAAKPVPHRTVGGKHHKGPGAPSPAGKLHKPKGPKTAPSALAGEGHHRG